MFYFYYITYMYSTYIFHHDIFKLIYFNLDPANLVIIFPRFRISFLRKYNKVV